MSALDRMVTVYDRVPFTAAPTPEQAAAYVRRVLPGWSERPVSLKGEGVVYTYFGSPGGECGVRVPMRTPEPNGDWSDYPRRMAELCDELVDIGVVARPSEALRAMAEEVVP